MTFQLPEGVERRLAIVLSGGGARGAYEVGVLSYLFEELEKIRNIPISVDILCGTSVGAINAAFLAAHLKDPAAGMAKLRTLWQGLELDQVLDFGFKQALGWLRPSGESGLINAAPLARIIHREIPWSQITQTMRAGRLKALSVTCTEVYTGRTVLFVQTGPTTTLPTHAPPNTLIRSERIGPQHVLASASLPILFPPVRVGRNLYMDGALRHNTPIAPAIRLGATHLFVVSTSREQRGITANTPAKSPTTALILGKIMNALLLDHLDNDLAHTRLVNDLLETGSLAYGEGFLAAHNRAAVARGGRVVQPTRVLAVRPSTTIGSLGSQYLRSTRIRTRSVLTRRLLDWLDPGEQADLPSYLLFDGGFVQQLIELGRADARAQRDRILDFLGDMDAPPSGHPASTDEWSYPAPVVG